MSMPAHVTLYSYLDLMKEFAKGCLVYLLHIPLVRMVVYGLGLIFLVLMEFCYTLERRQTPAFYYTALIIVK